MNNTFLIKLNSHISNIRERYGHLPICELLVSIAIELQSLIRGYIPKGTQYHISVNGYEICAKEIILTFD